MRSPEPITPEVEDTSPPLTDESDFSTLNPYEVLGLLRTATAAEIRSSYRKLALRDHPDKNPSPTAHVQFQRLAFAYSLLSCPNRRAYYDRTGLTSTLESGTDFDWREFYATQYESISALTIDEFRVEYQRTGEETRDVLNAYIASKGCMNAVFSKVLASSPLEDEDRFRKILDDAIKNGEVKAYAKYTNESTASRHKRRREAEAEAGEAVELAKDLGLHDKLFGNGKGKKSSKGEELGALSALIKNRQQSRMEGLFASMEAKYGGGSTKKKKGTPTAATKNPPIPSEEEFEAARARLEGGRNNDRAKRRRT
jgi:DnaJ family protein C protein 9